MEAKAVARTIESHLVKVRLVLDLIRGKMLLKLLLF